MKKKIIFLITLSLFTVSGCATYDRLGRTGNLTELIPTRIDSEYQYFQYRCFAYTIYPLNDDKAEATRIKWLEQWLSENGYSDYEIISRQPIFKQKSLLGSMYDIYYEVRAPKK